MITTKNTAQLTGDFEELFNRSQKGTNALGLILTDTAFANHMKKSTKNLDKDLKAAQHSFLLKGLKKNNILLASKLSIVSH